MKNPLKYYIQEGLVKLFSFPHPENPDYVAATVIAVPSIIVTAGRNHDDDYGPGWVDVNGFRYEASREFWSEYSEPYPTHTDALIAARDWHMTLSNIHREFTAIQEMINHEHSP